MTELSATPPPMPRPDRPEQHRLARTPPRPVLRYLVAALAPAVIIVATRTIHWIAPTAVPPFSLAVAVAALYGGWGPGVLASVLSALGYAFFPNLLTGAAGLTRMSQFVVLATALTWVAGSVYRQRWRAERQAEENARLRALAERAAVRALEATALAEGEAVKAAAVAAGAEVAAKHMAEAKARFAAIIDSSTDAIIGKTLDGVVTSWNPAAERIFGYGAEEMVGESIFRLIPDELRSVEENILDRLRRGETVEYREAERLRKDGRRIWISLSVSPVRDASGAITGVASIKRDVTEKKLAGERLRDTERQRAIGQLAGGVAHEANNQMLVILGAAHFLLKRGDLSERAREDLESIRQAAERTASVTQQLLAFGRRQALRIEDVDLNRLVEGFAPVLRRLLVEHHELVLELESQSRRVRADPRQLEQVLLNLALNARDAMPQGGRLTIATGDADDPAAERPTPSDGSDPSGYVRLVVKDSGHGMDAATLERAFEPFFTTKDIGFGSGLGLSVVDGIVSQSGGFLRAASAPGKGATFSLYFPVASDRLPVDSSKVDDSSANGAGRGVLIVEDELTVRAMAARALAGAKYTVLEAAHGEEALRFSALTPGGWISWSPTSACPCWMDMSWPDA